MADRVDRFQGLATVIMVCSKEVLHGGHVACQEQYNIIPMGQNVHSNAKHFYCSCHATCPLCKTSIDCKQSDFFSLNHSSPVLLFVFTFSPDLSFEDHAHSYNQRKSIKLFSDGYACMGTTSSEE